MTVWRKERGKWFFNNNGGLLYYILLNELDGALKIGMFDYLLWYRIEHCDVTDDEGELAAEIICGDDCRTTSDWAFQRDGEAAEELANQYGGGDR